MDRASNDADVSSIPPLSFAEQMRMLPSSSLTVPDVQISRFRFFMAKKLCSRSVAMDVWAAGRAGLFNALYKPLYERLMLGSIAAIQSASAILVTPFARAMLSA